jgi:hypothetical protein
MEKGFTNELMRLVGSSLKGQVVVQPIIPLVIKLPLERLRLAELIGPGWDNQRAETPSGQESQSAPYRWQFFERCIGEILP